MDDVPHIPTADVVRPPEHLIQGPFYTEPKLVPTPHGNAIEVRLGYTYSVAAGSHVWVNAWLDARKTDGYASWGTVQAQVTAGTGWQDADIYANINGWTRASQERAANNYFNAAGDVNPWVAAGGSFPGSQGWPD
jgi:hypothetical protein